MVRIVHVRDLEVDAYSLYDLATDGCAYADEGRGGYTSRREAAEEETFTALPQPPAVELGIDAMEESCAPRRKRRKGS